MRKQKWRVLLLVLVVILLTIVSSRVSPTLPNAEEPSVSDEIYVTVFEKQEALIKLFSEYGFIQKTTQMTEKADGSFEEELVLVKSMNDNTYPNFDWSNKNTFIVPIQQQYHEMLFPESETSTQLSFGDLQGVNTYANTIKKAYICKAQTQQIKPGDILLFYASENKRSITTSYLT